MPAGMKRKTGRKIILNIVVVDGMGGGMGSQVVSQLVGQKIDEKARIVALGTNSHATNSMLRAGAAKGATGENAICFTIRCADIIIAPIGVVIPNAMLGEITPRIAEAIACADGKKILIPVAQTHFEIVGLEMRPLVQQIKEAVVRVVEILEVDCKV